MSNLLKHVLKHKIVPMGALAVSLTFVRPASAIETANDADLAVQKGAGRFYKNSTCEPYAPGCAWAHTTCTQANGAEAGQEQIQAWY